MSNYSLQQIEAFKQVNYIGKITGTMFRVTKESSLADFLWQNQGYFQQSNVTREVIESNPQHYEVFIFNEEDYVV